jgi:hypothetical protein
VFFISRQWLHRFLTMSEPGPINNRDVCCEHGGMLLATGVAHRVVPFDGTVENKKCQNAVQE